MVVKVKRHAAINWLGHKMFDTLIDEKKQPLVARLFKTIYWVECMFQIQGANLEPAHLFYCLRVSVTAGDDTRLPRSSRDILLDFSLLGPFRGPSLISLCVYNNPTRDKCAT